MSSIISSPAVWCSVVKRARQSSPIVRTRSKASKNWVPIAGSLAENDKGPVKTLSSRSERVNRSKKRSATAFFVLARTLARVTK
jgi:hypothetical protein